MDFITWPELFLSLVAVAGVFIAVVGAMVVLAAELTEEGRWFSIGVLLPLALIVGATFFHGGVRGVFTITAAAIALTVPWVLAWKCRTNCLKSVVAGSGLFVFGSAVVALVLSMHFDRFVQ